MKSSKIFQNKLQTTKHLYRLHQNYNQRVFHRYMCIFKSTMNLRHSLRIQCNFVNVYFFHQYIPVQLTLKPNQHNIWHHNFFIFLMRPGKYSSSMLCLKTTEQHGQHPYAMKWDGYPKESEIFRAMIR